MYPNAAELVETLALVEAGLRTEGAGICPHGKCVDDADFWCEDCLGPKEDKPCQ